jgi:hypothetical protein
MAIYCLRPAFVSRRNGSSVTQAAAYRAGERVRDTRSGTVFDHSHRNDVLDRQIALPAELALRPEMIWAYDRERLWNEVEQHARRRDALLAREWMAALPSELFTVQQLDLARRFGREPAQDRFGSAMDVCVHAPRDTSDERNYHAHVLMTTRVVRPDGFGRRTARASCTRPNRSWPSGTSG